MQSPLCGVLSVAFHSEVSSILGYRPMKRGEGMEFQGSRAMGKEKTKEWLLRVMLTQRDCMPNEVFRLQKEKKFEVEIWGEIGY